MGIKGIYHEIGTGQRIALSKLAIETLEQQGRPLRLAIDISIWLFQIQSGRGGTNPALRTFYYRLLRLISLSIHPLFVFDGPNKPPFKRGKRTGPNVASIPEFLAKQLLKQFAIPFHIAPGEAEAECALLQREGIVDAVLSEDVDTLMFGSGLTMRNWSPEGTLKTRTFTHVNLYDSRKNKESAGLDREGMILVALMSGGDYIPEGIPGCGPKTACEAARAGFGRDLCSITRHDSTAIAEWKTRLTHELRTNESKFFRAKHKALVIPDDFPRQDVLRYYTHPCVSPAEKVESLRRTIKWDKDLDIIGLREFTGEAFDWTCVSGAKKFIRNLAPALLAKELRLNNTDERPRTSDACDVAMKEARLINTIHLKRQHISTDNMTELRIGYIPIDLVPIDLSAEDPDPELPLDENSDGDEAEGEVEAEAVEGVLKKRGPLLYDPTILEKMWVSETLIKLGIPLKFQDWEESFRNAQKFTTMKGITKRAEKALKIRGGMEQGALNRFTKVTKPGLDRTVSKEPASRETSQAPSRTSEPPSAVPQDLPPVLSSNQPASKEQADNRPKFQKPPAFPSTLLPALPPTPPRSRAPAMISLLSSPDPADAAPAKRKRTLRRSQSDTSHLSKPPARSVTPELTAPLSKVAKPTAREELEPIPELPSSVTIRRHRSPLRRTQSISSTGTLHQTTLLDPKQPGFRTLPTAPILPSLPPITRPKRPLSASGPENDTPRKHSTTPEKSKQTNIITISSSPAGTPTSARKSITEYFSPSRRQPPDSPSRSRLPPPPFPNIVSSTAPSNVGKPDFRKPLGKTSSTMLNSTNSGSTSFDAEDVELERAKVGKTSTAVAATATFVVPPKPNTLSRSRSEVVRAGERIRLRESLDGAWAIEPVDATTGGRSDGVDDGTEAGKKRKRHVGKIGGWRLSQVGVVDLT